MLIRCVHDGDWGRIWPLWHRVVATGRTYAWAPDTDESAARAVWLLPEPAVVFVAEDEGGLVGTAQLKPNQPGLGDHIANAAVMVDPDVAGRGIGRALAEHVIAHACAAGYRGMQFNAVVETNTAAVTLWLSLGFRVLATVPAAFRHAELGDVGLHIMFLEL